MVSATVSQSFIDLTVDIEQSPGDQYSLSMSGVLDLNYNEVSFSDEPFTGFVPTAPSERRFSWDGFVPARVLARDDAGTGDLRLLLACFQDVTDIMIAEIDNLPNIFGYDGAFGVFLDALLCDLGNPFSFTLDDNKKSKLASILVDIYRLKGTAPGIENAIRFFVGVEATVVPFFGSGMQLGVSLLNEDWVLGPGTQRDIYTFGIEVDVELTDEQESQIDEIATYMKPAWTHYAGIRLVVEPSLWILDQSTLNNNTKLG
jgi:phage tail-like protein